MVPSETWDFILQYEPGLRALCRKACRGREDVLDELWEECLDRVPRIIETWDPDYGVGLWTYLARSLRLYLWKWMNANMRRMARHESIKGSQGSYSPDHSKLVLSDEVQYYLQGLSDWDRWLLTTYYAEGYTFDEMGSVLNVTKGTVRLYVQAALARAKHQVKWRGPLHRHVQNVIRQRQVASTQRDSS